MTSDDDMAMFADTDRIWQMMEVGNPVVGLHELDLLSRNENQFVRQNSTLAIVYLHRAYVDAQHYIEMLEASSADDSNYDKAWVLLCKYAVARNVDTLNNIFSLLRDSPSGITRLVLSVMAIIIADVHKSEIASRISCGNSGLTLSEKELSKYLLLFQCG